MNRFISLLTAVFLAAALSACGDTAKHTVSEGTGPDPVLPDPSDNLIPTVNVAPAVGWPSGRKPTPAKGLKVQAFASGLDHPRWIYVLPNGDVLVAETNAPSKSPGEDEIGGWFSGIKEWVVGLVKEKAGAAVESADRITLLRDTDRDGTADQRSTFLEGLTSPFGMALVGNDFYVANTDSLDRYPYRSGAVSISAPGNKIVDLPARAPNRHWTKSLLASRDGTRLFIGIGSNSDHGENGIDREEGRAAIWEVDPKTGNRRVFASGLRNPVGMDWEPVSGNLWVAVNERDQLGSDLVPDYMTAVKQGEFYGWPYSYYGQIMDARVEPQRPDLVKRARVPDYALGPHTASLGLAFGDKGTLTERFRNGVFIGQHGSWNRDPPSGYKVVFVPFENGRPAGRPVTVLDGFLDGEGNAQGRPVGVVPDGRGGLLVADDVGNVVWRVSVDDTAR